MDNTVLILTLQELWNNDDNVPPAANFRCTELDWFSGGIKDNVVKHIANEVLGKKKSEELFGD